MSVLDYIKRYGWLLALLVSGFAILIWRRSNSGMVKALQEFRSIQAEEDAAKSLASHGFNQSIRQIEQRYATELTKLQRTSKAEVDELRKDPRKLAAALARLGRPF